MLAVFGQSGYGDIQMKFVLYHFSHHFHLPLSTVGNDEVGQGGTFLYGTAIPAAYHLFHRGVEEVVHALEMCDGDAFRQFGLLIVGSGHSLDDVFPVLLLAWFRLFENDAGGHRVRALNIGIIETFDVVR